MIRRRPPSLRPAWCPPLLVRTAQPQRCPCVPSRPRACAAHSTPATSPRTPSPPHTPVLLSSVLSHLGGRTAPLFLDGTVGAGGHAAALIANARIGHYVGLDRDPAALALASARLAPIAERAGTRLTLLRADFRDHRSALARAGAAGEPLAGALLDVGVSSMQLDDAARGFSFMRDGPLDMRMGGPGDGPSAADVVNGAAQDELARLFRELGEEPRARLMADRVVRGRPFETTLQLADALAAGRRFSGRGVHPATLCFQALRIAVNGELDALARAVPEIAHGLAPGGRLGVIAFHSLEDRIVKRAFKEMAGEVGGVRVLTKRPLVADEQEGKENVRSRSAKLRFVERLEVGEVPRIGKVNKYRPDG